MAAVIAGTINTWLMYCIGRQLCDERTGWYAALVYTASIYGFIIVGVFILPDAPQSVFWLAAILFLLKAFKGEIDKTAKQDFLLASLMIGLAFLSKYTTAYLWLGMIVYILVYNHNWLKNKAFYLAHLIMVVLFFPVLWWNSQNGFVSFLFHSGRVEPQATPFNLDFLLTEILGESFYTNPIVLVLIMLSVVTFFIKKNNIAKPETKLLLWSALPLILTFLVVSLFRRTLPHWNGAGYLTLIPMAALWLRNRSEAILPKALKAALAFMLTLLILSTAQILTGFIPIEKLTKNITGSSIGDYSLEVYGWGQLREGFIPLADKYEKEGKMSENAPIVSYRWFPAANFDYYAARGTGRFVMATGDTASIHKYVWINQLHGSFRLNSNAWYITSSRDYRHPRSINTLYYNKISQPDTIPILRMGKPVYYFYVYRLNDLQMKR